MSTVLVAEDDLAIRELLTFLLDTSGHRVLACADGGTALDTARTKFNPEVVLKEVAIDVFSGKKFGTAKAQTSRVVSRIAVAFQREK